MSQKHRLEQIMDLIQKSGFVTTEQLVDEFGVTPQTIRRDLNELAGQNRLRRHHGGAGVDSSTANTAYHHRKIMNLEAKERIANTLVRHIPDNASMFINIGTTTETIAKELLQKRGLSIVTNNLHVASILSAKEDFHIIVAGGEVRNRDGGIVGEAAVDFINQFKMDYGIIGISGIHHDGSLLDFDYREVRVSQSIIANSTEVLLAADHSKFGRNAMVRLGSIGQAHHLFTDAPPPEKIRKLLETNGVELHITDK